MFDFMDLFTFGRRFEAHGQEWVSVNYLHDGFHIAAKSGDELPSPLFVVKEEKKVEETANK